MNRGQYLDARTGSTEHPSLISDPIPKFIYKKMERRWALKFAEGSVQIGSLLYYRSIKDESGMIVDPHTADGIKVGRALRANDLPLICVETALPAKFSTTIQEALGREPARAPAFAGIESRPQHVISLPLDAARLKSFIAEHALRS